jgi:glycosyl transferase family 25
MLFDRFDTIRIINLAFRKDRRSEMEGELRKVGLLGDPRVSFFDACTFDDPGGFSSRGARGVYASHLAILREAAANGQSVLILEDDADFEPGAADHVLPEDWQIFYGGYFAAEPDRLEKSDVQEAHMMGFSADIVPPLVEYLSNLRHEGIHPPIDGAYVWFRRAFPEVRTHFAVPQLAFQRPSRTDIADLPIYDRLPLFREGVGLLRKLKRRFGFGRR